MALAVAFLLAFAAQADATVCGNAIDLGNQAPPWQDFGNCDVAAAVGLCDDPAVSDVVTSGCKLACGKCPSDATELSPSTCPYTLTINSGTWAEEISFEIDPLSDHPIVGPASSIPNHFEWTKVSRRECVSAIRSPRA